MLRQLEYMQESQASEVALYWYKYEFIHLHSTLLVVNSTSNYSASPDSTEHSQWDFPNGPLCQGSEACLLELVNFPQSYASPQGKKESWSAPRSPTTIVKHKLLATHWSSLKEGKGRKWVVRYHWYLGENIAEKWGVKCHPQGEASEELSNYQKAPLIYMCLFPTLLSYQWPFH